MKGRAAVPSNDEFDAFGESGMHYRTPEKRRCDECGHAGTDGGSKSESYCGGCGSTVPYPAEDVCPICGMTNCMLIACPECGGQYSLDEEQGDDIETPNALLHWRCFLRPVQAIVIPHIYGG